MHPRELPGAARPRSPRMRQPRVQPNPLCLSLVMGSSPPLAPRCSAPGCAALPLCRAVRLLPSRPGSFALGHVSMSCHGRRALPATVRRHDQRITDPCAMDTNAQRRSPVHTVPLMTSLTVTTVAPQLGDLQSPLPNPRLHAADRSLASPLPPGRVAIDRQS